jgi:hypothetical protein
VSCGQSFDARFDVHPFDICERNPLQYFIVTPTNFNHATRVQIIDINWAPFIWETSHGMNYLGYALAKLSDIIDIKVCGINTFAIVVDKLEDV